ncbi:MAG: sel1 repeat family protein [Deltaproteobacteria bacterium]|nr:MAG: sel1 repeat family protein [Deltaproteobacteria bacterium]
MPSLHRMLVLFALLGAASARAESRRPIGGQAPTVPLFTAVRADDERTLGKLLRFEGFERKRLLPWRDRLEPLASGGDPIAQLWLARLYDLFPFGKGTPEEGQVAMTWYKRAADQHLAVAEHFLFRVHNYGLLGAATDVQQALAFLERAYADSAGALKAEIALDLARMYMGPHSEAAGAVPGAPDEARGLRYLEEALQLDPKNQSAIDWLLDIYAARGDDARAVKLAERSQNGAMIEKIAELCLHKLQDPRCAIRLLNRARLWPSDDKGPSQVLLDLYTLVCRKQLVRGNLGAIDTPEAWKYFQQQQRNCVVGPGG